MILESLIRREIHEQGPMPVSRFMELALYHPEHGYYSTRPVLGHDGDFITSPEMTQVFGELIALWCIDLWKQLGEPIPVQVIELGPGRGTMMMDMLRVFKQFPQFYGALTVSLVEASPHLKAQQQQALADHPLVNWFTMLSNVPNVGTHFIVANEFFDALPIQQFCLSDQHWVERRIGLATRNLVFMGSDPIRENCPAYQPIMTEITQRLAQNQGGALIIDYGDYTKGDRFGDTLQAVHQNRRAEVLTSIGNNDLSHHVNFAALIKLIDPPLVHQFSTQGEFLRGLGLKQRTEFLCQRSDPKTAYQLRTAAARLTSQSQMGNLFKVLSIINPDHQLSFK
ncbi:MAG: SAM-dependent methyltransferase [Alphaproteobacteria bacterium]|nr:SAM-dependent methyltransferase [Alphaproteobacteria bacterium]